MNTPITVLDGALGTLLCDTVSPEASASPLWSSVDLLQNPSRLSSIHLEYLRAGARCIETATYQLSHETISRAGVFEDSQIKLICRTAMRIALDSIKKIGDGEVALSLGPFGGCLSPSQEYSGIYPTPYDSHNPSAKEELEKWHTDRLQLFSGASPELFEQMDVLAFETVPFTRADEIVSIRRVLDTEKFMKRKAWISIVCTELPTEAVTKDIVKAALGGIPPRCGARGIGVNCTKLRYVKEVVRVYTKAVKEMGLKKEDIFLVVYPDGGLTYDVDTQCWSQLEEGSESIEKWCDDMVEIAKEARDEGCWGGIVVGGCCKAGPNYIKKLAEMIS